MPGSLVAGSLVEGALLAGAEVVGAEVVGAAVEGTAVVAGALVGAADVGGATVVVVGWSAPGIAPVVVGCATAGRPAAVMASRPSSVASATTTNTRRGGKVLLKGPASDEQ